MNDSLEDLFNQIKELFDEFVEEHNEHQTDNKAAGRRARKAINELKKLVTPYKKESVKGDKLPFNR